MLISFNELYLVFFLCDGTSRVLSCQERLRKWPKLCRKGGIVKLDSRIHSGPVFLLMRWLLVANCVGAGCLTVWWLVCGKVCVLWSCFGDVDVQLTRRRSKTRRTPWKNWRTAPCSRIVGRELPCWLIVCCWHFSGFYMWSLTGVSGHRSQCSPLTLTLNLILNICTIFAFFCTTGTWNEIQMKWNSGRLKGQSAIL